MGVRLLDIRDKLIVFGIVTGIFLPVRLVFYTYVSTHWIGSLGLVTSVMLTITFLAHKNRLGRFGTIFISQMTKTMKGKSGMVAMGLSLIFIAYLGSTLVWIERGYSLYHDEKQIVSQMNFSSSDVTHAQVRDLAAILQSHRNDPLPGFSRLDSTVSMSYAIMNDLMGGWLVNLDTILLMEQFEVLGLIVFYRKVGARYMPAMTHA